MTTRTSADEVLESPPLMGWQGSDAERRSTRCGCARRRMIEARPGVLALLFPPNADVNPPRDRAITTRAAVCGRLLGRSTTCTAGRRTSARWSAACRRDRTGDYFFYGCFAGPARARTAEMPLGIASLAGGHAGCQLLPRRFPRVHASCGAAARYIATDTTDPDGAFLPNNLRGPLDEMRAQGIRSRPPAFLPQAAAAISTASWRTPVAGSSGVSVGRRGQRPGLVREPRIRRARGGRPASSRNDRARAR